MEHPELSRSFILETVLDQLNFTPPTYNHEQNEHGLYKTHIRFNARSESNQASTDDIHSISGCWFHTIEEAQQFAANSALTYLEKKINFHVHDFSYTILKRTKQHNQSLTTRACAISHTLSALLCSWQAMIADINHSIHNCETQVIMQRSFNNNISDNSATNLLLCCVTAVSKSLSRQTNEDSIAIHNIYGETGTLITHFLQLNKDMRQLTPEPTGEPVLLAPTTLLSQLLDAQDAQLPTYHYTTQDDGTVTCSCKFYPCQGVPDDEDIQTVYGFPTTNNATATESSALRSLEHIDNYFHIHLHDYNYSRKEKEIDRNRDLLKKKRHLEAALFKTYNLFREAAMDLDSTLQTLRTRSNIPPASYSEEYNAPAFKSAYNAILDIQFQLETALQKANEILELYNTPHVRRLQY